jgi:hypothetical protein
MVDDYVPTYDPTDDHVMPNKTDPIDPPKEPKLK